MRAYAHNVVAGIETAIRRIINPKCSICFGLGWVCENPADRAWDAETGLSVWCRDALPMPRQVG
jgi:hypothetical protein